jgi:DNA polymerase-3 subunit gamma/tau
LGFRPAQFSAKVLEAFDSIRLEQALDILLDCYRDIRYSVSPRFELENAVSKLSWLTRWVSPAELGEALGNAQSLLHAGAGKPVSNNAPTALPTAQPAAQNAKPSAGGQPEGSLTAAFKQMIAKKETPMETDSADDEDVPLWDSVVQTKKSEPEVSPQVECVVSMIAGTIIEKKRSGE